MRKKALTIEVNPRVIFPEDEDESDHELSVDEGISFAPDVPARGDPEKWRIIHQAEHLTGFNNCSVCSSPLIFPAPACQQCLTAYHFECRRELSEVCLCEVYSTHSPAQRSQMFSKAIADAKKHAKNIDLAIKTPPKASIMELKYQI